MSHRRFTVNERARIVASETLSSYRPPASLTAIATPTTRLVGMAVWLGHLASKGISRWLIYFKRSLFCLSPIIYHCFVNNSLLTVCRQNPSPYCPCSTRTWFTKRRSCSQTGDQRCLKGDPRDPRGCAIAAALPPVHMRYARHDCASTPLLHGIRVHKRGADA